ncbi:hypothetical protein TEA_028356 [Camellia sinensis var. sinensis]|uniref:Helicase ATP-binding domain-containing protein n=1 Tax=Camellia sinensis var. sinensis TaxID=542762 RepID=A0A4S4F158_CAMSN|nr:hypothetical protein TEA_028356 [Camellia sinensis var. sinensis]
MWSTIANLKENLNKMALDVHHHDYDYDYDYHDDNEQQEEELGIYDSPNRNGHLVSDHRFSHNFAYSLQPSHSNRFEDSPDNFEVEQYKVEIKRLHESEAEIKALSVNYAALLKEKEDRISRLNEENSLLKQNLNATNAALNSSRNESFKTSTNSMNGLKSCVRLMEKNSSPHMTRQSRTGNTATFCSGILQQLDYSLVKCQALVLPPTLELTQQSVKVHACVGGTSVREDQRILSSGVHVVVGTPGRVFDMLRRQSLRPVYIKMFVLDEADEMLSRVAATQNPGWGVLSCCHPKSRLGCSQLLPPKIQVGVFSVAATQNPGWGVLSCCHPKSRLGCSQLLPPKIQVGVFSVAATQNPGWGVLSCCHPKSRLGCSQLLPPKIQVGVFSVAATQNPGWGVLSCCHPKSRLGCSQLLPPKIQVGVFSVAATQNPGWGVLSCCHPKSRLGCSQLLPPKIQVGVFSVAATQNPGWGVLSCCHPKSRLGCSQLLPPKIQVGVFSVAATQNPGWGVLSCCHPKSRLGCSQLLPPKIQVGVFSVAATQNPGWGVLSCCHPKSRLGCSQLLPPKIQVGVFSVAATQNPGWGVLSCCHPKSRLGCSQLLPPKIQVGVFSVAATQNPGWGVLSCCHPKSRLGCSQLLPPKIQVGVFSVAATQNPGWGVLSCCHPKSRLGCSQLLPPKIQVGVFSVAATQNPGWGVLSCCHPKSRLGCSQLLPPKIQVGVFSVAATQNPGWGVLSCCHPKSRLGCSQLLPPKIQVGVFSVAATQNPGWGVLSCCHPKSRLGCSQLLPPKIQVGVFSVAATQNPGWGVLSCCHPKSRLGCSQLLPPKIQVGVFSVAATQNPGWGVLSCCHPKSRLGCSQLLPPKIQVGVFSVAATQNPGWGVLSCCHPKSRLGCSQLLPPKIQVGVFSVAATQNPGWGVLSCCHPKSRLGCSQLLPPKIQVGVFSVAATQNPGWGVLSCCHPKSRLGCSQLLPPKIQVGVFSVAATQNPGWGVLSCCHPKSRLGCSQLLPPKIQVGVFSVAATQNPGWGVLSCCHPKSRLGCSQLLPPKIQVGVFSVAATQNPGWGVLSCCHPKSRLGCSQLLPPKIQVGVFSVAATQNPGWGVLSCCHPKSRLGCSQLLPPKIQVGVFSVAATQNPDLLEEKNMSLAAIQAAHESEINNLGLELEKERDKLANIQLKLQEELKLNESFQEELNLSKVDKDKKMEMNKIHDELNEKISEVRRLQIELTRRENAETDDIAEGLKRVIATLEENNNLKMEKVELEAALKAADNSSPHKIPPHNHQEISNSLNEKDQSTGHFPGKEEMELSLQKLEKDLKETCQQRDKALQELNRLKQHLLDKVADYNFSVVRMFCWFESEESEKMDEDSKIIEELREKNEFLKLQNLNLEKAQKHAIASQEEVKMTNNNELQKYEEIIDDLKRKLTSCMSTIDAKNVELLNLQTALGQYYAEIEAKEHLEGDMARAREELAKLSEDAHQQAGILKSEKEDSLKKLSQAERILAEGRNRVNKLEEDNAKLRRACEQSMSRINRMSMDSDYFVDRRIVIKLLVTYFQRNHSKEVLDLMVRMLGFSDEDKQRIGVAQQGAGKGVVRGVLGIPGRLVGGLWSGGSAESNANMASENQSFADLWVDFLLKETEEREKRESAEAINASNGDARTNATGAAFSFSRLSPSPNQNSPLLSQGNIQQSDHSDSEFSTVPLTSSEHNLWVDFPLKETEEREKRESAEAINASNGDARTNAIGAAFSFSQLSPSLNQNSPPLSQGNIQQSDHSDSEFSTVPLTLSEHSFQNSDGDSDDDSVFPHLANSYTNPIEIGVSLIDLSNDEDTKSNEEDDDERMREVTDSATWRAFREDESRQNAPLTAETTTRVMEGWGPRILY